MKTRYVTQIGPLYIEGIPFDFSDESKWLLLEAGNVIYYIRKP